MIKKVFVLMVIGYCLIQSPAQAQITKSASTINKLGDSTISVRLNATVPAHNYYYFYDAQRKIVGSFNPGEVINLATAKTKNKGIEQIVKTLSGGGTKPVNCFKTSCPSGAPSGAVCWDCH